MRYCNSALITLATMLLSVSAHGSSPWCEPIPDQFAAPWAKEAFDKGDAIFLGLVHSVEYVEPKGATQSSTDREASSMTELLKMIEEGQRLDRQQFDHIITFRIETAWKGISTAKFVKAKIFVGKHLNMNPIHLGERYLVVGKEADDSGVWIRNLCSDAIKKEWASSLISKLDDIFVGRQAAGQNTN